MEILPHYDEFGIYTTKEDINSYVALLIEQGVSSEEDVFTKCLEYFGNFYIDLIEKVLYGED
jgi:hypothetical protein